MEKRHDRRKWSEAEDAILRKEVEAQLIALKLPGRSNKDCRKRWSKSVEGGRKGSWSEDEDQRLIKAVSSYGTRWTQVASHVATRHADQCAKRWQHSLDPNINRRDWTQQEDDTLYLAVCDLGRNWREIASTVLRGRSTTHLKNRYELICRRRQDQDSNTPTQVPSEFFQEDQEDGFFSKTLSHQSVCSDPQLDPWFYNGPNVQHQHLNPYIPNDFRKPPNPNTQPIDKEQKAVGSSGPVTAAEDLLLPSEAYLDLLQQPFDVQTSNSGAIWNFQTSNQTSSIDAHLRGDTNINDPDVISGLTSPLMSSSVGSEESSDNGSAKGCEADRLVPNWTLVLEGLEVDTLGFICDSLMRKNVQVDMKIHQNYG